MSYAVVDSGPTAEELATVINLAERQSQLEDRIAELQKELDDTMIILRQIQERDLPEAMSQAGVEDYTLTGGKKVAIDTKIVASPTKAQQPEMLDWLESNEHEDLIKHEIKVAFGKGEFDRAERLLAWVHANMPKQKIDDKKYVHPQTLSAFVREQMKDQVDLPDAFGVVVLRKSIISRPKQPVLL